MNKVKLLRTKKWHELAPEEIDALTAGVVLERFVFAMMHDLFGIRLMGEYSRNMRKAWELVERFSQEHVGILVAPYYLEGQGFRVSCNIGLKETDYCTCDKAPEGICKMALWAGQCVRYSQHEEGKAES